MVQLKSDSFKLVPTEVLLPQVEALVANAGLIPRQFMSEFAKELHRRSDPRRALNNFHRFLVSAFSVSFIRELTTNKIPLKIALDIFSQSQYLADILVRSPELFPWLISTDVLKTTKSRGDFLSEAEKAIQPFERSEKKLSVLKRFQRREILRIGTRDILREAEMPVITEELSGLADAVISCVLSLGEDELKRDAGFGPESSLSVVGLGKLGGNELNFSSDIDLMFVYEHDRDVPDSPTRIRTNFEYYNRLAEYVVRKLSEHTEEGHLYRVDMRLRPDGGAGPLAMSRLGYRTYYETRGELWERQMLLKARVVAGDKIVGREWLNDLEPFVFPKTHLSSPLAEIAEVKKKIESHLPDDLNIKLGMGGIRDIEFVVQALQLVNAGGNRNLRESNTFAALKKLLDSSLLKPQEYAMLSASYEFFRTVEHRLQLLYGQQTHSLPEHHDEAQKLSKALGLKNAEALEKIIQTKRRDVKRIFDSIFESGKSRREIGTKLRTLFFEEVKFVAAEEGSKNSEILLANLDSADLTIQKNLVSAIKKYRAIDWGVRNLACLSSGTAISRGFNQAVRNEKLADLLTLVACRSSRFSELLAKEPVLFESFVSRPDEMLTEEIAFRFLGKNDPVRFKLFNEFRIGVEYLLGYITTERFTGMLSDLAERIISSTFDEIINKSGVCLIGMGKFGGREITVGSDIDLVCLYKDEHKRSEVEKSLVQFVKFFESNRIYELDFRLRPEGKNSPIATQVDYYLAYLKSRAALWERQSLLKAKYVAGDRSLAEESLASLKKQAYADIPRGWGREILRMRKKMEIERTKNAKASTNLKLGAGGLADIEFGIQAFQLANRGQGKQFEESNSFRLLDSIQKIKILHRLDARTLAKNYEYLRRLETMIRINSEYKEFVVPIEKVERKGLSIAMGEKSTDRFEQKVKRIRKDNRRIFLEILRQCRE